MPKLTRFKITKQKSVQKYGCTDAAYFNLNVFIRMQKWTKADEIVYCAFYLQAISEARGSADIYNKRSFN